GSWVSRISYGRLDQILVCQLPPDRNFWGNLAGKVRLLAVLTPYRTGGRDAALNIVPHYQSTAPIVADIQSIMAVVGRIQSGGKWYIIDRTGGMMRPEFIPSDETEDEGPDESNSVI
ncbi:hypothetical protein B0H14DRAFT_3716279, partial [Mycena olivaceomarginata]